MAHLQENDTHLEQQLKNYYQRIAGEPPDPVGVWNQLLPQLDSQRKFHRWHLPLRTGQRRDAIVAPPQRLRSGYKLPVRGAVVLAALVAILVMLVGAAYAAGIPILTTLFHLESGTQQILQTNQYTDYHQSKSVNGFTITIEKAYADANRVIIGYTITGPANRNQDDEFAFGLSTLTTAQGVKLPFMKGIGSLAVQGISGNTSSFDASTIQGNPKELQLHLAIPFGTHLLSAAFKITGALTFNFVVPFHAGKVINVHQSVVADGKTVTLERVVITASETRLYIQGFNAQDKPNGYSIVANLSVPGQTYTGGGGNRATGLWTMNFDIPLLGKHGQWTLAIRKEITLKDSSTGLYHLVPVSGALWTFHFTVS
jgi:hypothetical protein